MSYNYPTPRAILFASTFWEVLPSHYNKIKTRWAHVAHLYDEAKSDILATDRAGALHSLKAELGMLENDLIEYSDIVKYVDITEVAGIYVVAGKSRHRALQIAKQDLGDLKVSLKEVENKITDLKADIRYGLSNQ